MTYDEMRQMIEELNLTQCPKCENIFDVIPGELDRNIRDNEGKKLSEEALTHFSEHRIRCNKCSVNFCKTCNAQPYHLGMNCKEFKAPRCRFCHVVIPEENEEAVLKLVCADPECAAKYVNFCPKRHNICNHPCQGFLNEKNCLPCLDKRCAKKNEY
jgi:hypothetical protein